MPDSYDALSYAGAIYASRSVDVLSGDDDIPPPLATGQKVYGGSGLLAQQAGCPARAFVERRLGARELRKAVSGLDPMVRGELMHKVLELWYQKYPDSSSLSDMGDDTRAANLMNVIQQLFEPRLASEQGVLAIVNQQEAQRLQVVVEKFFGLEMQREPFTVVQTEEPAEVEIFGLKLSLKLDRVDRLSNGDLLVIDYKSSKIINSRWAPPRPMEAQLPLYAVTGSAQGIAIATVSSKEIRIDGWSDSETGLKNIKAIEKLKFDVDNWDELIVAWRESFDILAQEFLAGDFRINLHDPKLAQGEFGLVIRSSELPVVDDDEEESLPYD
ncbi:MAG: PD-(D/E)XK nuclease family protein [Gammaproteobacteria bacterium]|nr:PD-(D/E)XK nuclease family protein [Gammaproteobacteria bacterium]